MNKPGASYKPVSFIYGKTGPEIDNAGNERDKEDEEREDEGDERVFPAVFTDPGNFFPDRKCTPAHSICSVLLVTIQIIT
jgi:hypothetical protein